MTLSELEKRCIQAIEITQEGMPLSAEELVKKSFEEFRATIATVPDIGHCGRIFK